MIKMLYFMSKIDYWSVFALLWHKLKIACPVLFSPLDLEDLGRTCQEELEHTDSPKQGREM